MPIVQGDSTTSFERKGHLFAGSKKVAPYFPQMIFMQSAQWRPPLAMPHPQSCLVLVPQRMQSPQYGRGSGLAGHGAQPRSFGDTCHGHSGLRGCPTDGKTCPSDEIVWFVIGKYTPHSGHRMIADQRG